MKHISSIIAFVLILTLRVAAQSPAEPDRERYYTELRVYKHDFLSRELDLSREQQRNFFEIYDAMEDEIQQLNEQTRELERNVNSDGEATELEIDTAITAIYAQKQREAEIESRFLEQAREVLTPRQLLKLKMAERRFNQQLMRQHRRVRGEERYRGPRR